MESLSYRGEAATVLLRLPDGGALRATLPLAEGLAAAPAAGAAVWACWSADAAVVLAS